MRYLNIVLLFFFFNVTVLGQTRRMDNVEQARTYTSENQAQTVQPLLQEAERQFSALDYESTLFVLDNAVALNPYSTEALTFRAKLKRLVGLQREAEQDLKLVNSINPYAADLYGYNGNRGLLSILAIKPEQGVQGLNNFQRLNYYYETLDQKMDIDELRASEIDHIELVLEAIETNNLDQALDRIDKVLEQFPESAIAFDLKGLILKKQSRLEDAVEAFSKATALEPDFAIAWYNLGQIERSLQNFDKSKVYLNKAIELQSDLTKAYFERAVLHKQMGEQQAALNDYNTIIELKGRTYMEAFLNRGLTKKMLGDFTGALEDLKEVIDEFPDNADLRKNKGNLYLLFGMPRNAIDDYTKAIQLNDSYAEAYYNRAVAFLIIHDKMSACADLEKSMALGSEIAEKLSAYFCSW